MNIKLNGNAFYRVTSQFGEIDSAHPRPHTGIDLAISEGTKLYSPTNGIISDVVDYKNLNIGKGIIIKTEDGESLILGHLSDNSSVHVGQKVHVGDYLGLSGNTGHSTGAHLHVGLKDAHNHFINPAKYFGGNDIVNKPPTPISSIAHDTAQTMSPSDLLHHAISSLSDTLMDMGLNFIFFTSQLLSTHTLRTLADTILSLLS